MTPLAHAIAADMTLPVTKRVLRDGAGLGSTLFGFHFFEASSVIEAAHDLGVRIAQKGAPDRRLAFLPAPLTWIEYGEGNGDRAAFGLCDESGGGERAKVLVAWRSQDGGMATLNTGWSIPLSGCADMSSVEFPTGSPDALKRYAALKSAVLYGVLAMINTPRIIGRRQHMPHRGLQKRLVAAKAISGKFPLRAWTEIVLDVKPTDRRAEDQGETHLTGDRALHFVRAHLRISNGGLIQVSAHWRGNPALGMVQSRYALRSGCGAERRSA